MLGIAMDVTQETIEKRKIEYERDYDLLTNLLNRRAVRTALRKLFEHSENLGVSALLMLDLDNLKFVNDTYGHDVGDSYLQLAAQVLRKFGASQALVSRISGDEFIVFLYGYQTKDQVRQVIDEIKEKIHKTRLTLPGGDAYQLRASAGIAWYPDDSLDYEELIKFADFAMYKTKNTQKGEFYEFDSESYRKDSYLLRRREDLNLLIEDQMVAFYFQPIVDARTGAIYGYEALMRSLLQSLKSPQEILTLARSQSKLYQIERLTCFGATEAFFKDNRRRRPGRKTVHQLHTQSDAGRQRRDPSGGAVRRFIEPDRAGAHRGGKIRRFGSRLRSIEYVMRWNSGIALDDFGTGYNAETILSGLPARST